MAKRFGIVPYLFAEPLFRGLTPGAGKPLEDLPAHSTRPATSSTAGSSGGISLELTTAASPQLAIQLRQGHLDEAVLSPVDYAKIYSSINIVPTIGAISSGTNRR